MPQELATAVERGAVIRATATITGSAGRSGRVAATMESWRAGDITRSAATPMVVFGELAEAPRIGMTVHLVGTAAEADPGGSAALLFFLTEPATLVQQPPALLRWADALRSGLQAAASTLPGDGGKLLPGLAVGDTSAVDDPLDAAMKASSLSHLTAVSGANCAVVVALMMIGGAAIGLPRSWRIAGSIGILGAFVVLVTPEPSVLRAAVMASLVLVSMASGRPIAGLPVLGLAVILLLVFDPWLCRNAGFVLSVLATGGLLLMAAPLARLMSRWIPFPLALVISVPAAAQLACQPVLILLTPTLPAYGVVANVLAAPAAPVATVLGLISCVALPLVPWLGTAAAYLAWLPAAWIAAVAKLFSGLPGASLPWPPGLLGVALVVLVFGLGLTIVWGRGPRTGRLRRSAAITLVAILVGYLGVTGGEQLRRRVSPPADWLIAACDVGQGDAMLVRSMGQVAMIDTGPDSAAATDCLDILGVQRIDLLVLTHFDLDHVGGAAAVEGRVDQVIVGPSSGADDDRVVQSLAEAGAATQEVARGRTGSLGELRWDVLWPPSRLAGIEPGNDASVVLQFSGVGSCVEGCLSSVFLGDLGEDSQNRMLAGARVRPVDVVKVSHHGSQDQSSRLYEKVRASIGLIGVGTDNDYGHPTDDILAVLTSTATTVARTDRNGLVLVSMRDGVSYLWTEKSDDAPAQ